jgi:phytoene dehydrogenase-like protein
MVLVLERRKIIGGSVVTEEFVGFSADAVWTVERCARTS